jgi:hypothetical protein
VSGDATTSDVFPRLDAALRTPWVASPSRSARHEPLRSSDLPGPMP